jgi:hypothetical protein
MHSLLVDALDSRFMTEKQFLEYLRLNARMVPVLRSAVSEEERHEREQIYFGWVWYEVQAHPATLTKLVVDGIVKVNYKSNRHTNYLLADRKLVSQTLGKVTDRPTAHPRTRQASAKSRRRS